MRIFQACIILFLCVVNGVSGQVTKGSIREVDFRKYLLSRDNLGKNLKEEFPNEEPIWRIIVDYADLIGEGDEQAVVEATTAAMGNGGADIVEVFRIKFDGQLQSLTIDESDFSKFVDKELYEGQCWTPRLEVKGNKLIRWYIMYAKGDTEGNPKAGLKRIITYRWLKDRFRIESVKDVPDDGHN